MAFTVDLSTDTLHCMADLEQWIVAARKVFVAEGIGAVRVEPLATRLGVTTGSFYWHFTNRQTLLDALRDDWVARNTEPFFTSVAAAGADAEDRMLALIGVWFDRSAFDPAYDSAMRDWARIDPAARRVVTRADSRRVALIQSIFQGYGYAKADAFIRARVTYFHQVGYYSLGVRESRRVRLRLLPRYLEALVGRPPDRHKMKALLAYLG